MKISKYVSFDEATRSDTAIKYGIDNTPSNAAIEAMRRVAENVFDQVREHFGTAIGITSFFRSPALNKEIKGAPDSQHVKGQAIDINGHVYGNVLNNEIFEYILNNLDFDQLIWEFGDSKEPDWIHVSLTHGRNRKQALVSKIENGKTVYPVYKA